MTKETIIASISNGAKSLADIARSHSMSTGGSTTRKIKTLCPEVQALLTDNGLKEIKVETVWLRNKPKVIEPTKTNKINKSGNPYDFKFLSNEANLRSQIFAAAAKTERPRKELIAEVASALARPVTTIETFLSIMENPHDERNMGSANVSSNTTTSVLLAAY